jgi:hypothetical protein
MSNNDLLLGMSERTRLRAQVTYLMLKGAGYAAAAFVTIWIVVAALAWFGRTVLPEDAQMANDPAPQAFIEMAEQARAADAAAMAPRADVAAEEDAATTEEAAPAEEGEEAASE